MKIKYEIFRRFGIGIFLIFISITILVAGFIPNMVKIIERNISNNYYQTTAHIVSIKQQKRGHEVLVLFSIPGGPQYVASLDTYVEGMAVGDSVEIYYQKSKPTNVTLKGNQFRQAVLFGSVGGILLVVSIILLKKHKAKERIHDTF